MNRTVNSIFNFTTSLFSSLLLVVLNFVTRSCFLKYLGTSYLGIEGLFSNILSMLSLAELGFGSAIVYKLYKPIEINDRQRILVLMKLYKRVYQIIGACIFLIGVALIPFLPDLVKDYSRFSDLGLNAVAVFLLYLLKSASSYWFFSYKSSFVSANQKTYILTIVGYAINIANTVCQILVLALLHSFWGYILVQFLFTILTNLLYAVICNRKYPYLKEKTTSRISREEVRSFFKDCSALVLYRINDVVINASDNIVLSAFVGLDAVGLYANYLSVSWAIRSILSNFFESVKASLGSIYSTGNLEWSRLLYRVISFLTFWLYGIGAIGTAILMNDFITVWIGADYVVRAWTFEGYTISTPLGLLMGIEVYVVGQRLLFASFRGAMGLFQQTRFRPILSVLVNLIIILATVRQLGPAGCVLGTIISAFTTNFIYDPIVIQKYGLQQSSGTHFAKSILYKIVTVVAGMITWAACSLVPVTGILGFIIHGCMCVVIPSAFYFLLFGKTQEFSYLRRTAKDLLAVRFISNSTNSNM